MSKYPVTQINDNMLDYFGRRYDEPCGSRHIFPKYVSRMNELMDKVDPNGEKAIREARRMLLEKKTFEE